MISIVIPAHNEEAVIGRCLTSLISGSKPGELEIIVACNGCTDRTAEIAHAFGEPVRVVETQQASKIAALNLGDCAATQFPRCFVDADVELTIEAVRQVANLLLEGNQLAAAPAMVVDVSHSSWCVKAFYSIWLKQPYHRPGMLGGGFYAVSEAGRARFTKFPDIIADDEFVRSHFEEHERATPENCTFTIHAPRTVADLIRVKTRSRLGLYQLRSRFPELKENSYVKNQASVPRWISTPRLWPSAVVYLIVNLASKVRAKTQLSGIDAYQWERDNSSRQ
ncbi:MAG: glycosyl transferase [Chthoniobacteraceae bacterium]|nr:glycosyl transferase [Chthoniobacteraceae bacterium]